MSLDINLTNVQSTPIVVNANITAENNKVYHVIANATFTDPTPVEGRGYVVLLVNGTFSFLSSGNTFSQRGTLVFRQFLSGSWYTLTHDERSYNANTFVPQTRTINGLDLSANRTLTTANINDSTNKRYVTDAQLTVLGNTSGTNTGDQNLSGLVPYTGATADVDLDTFGLDAKFIKIKGTAGNGHLNLKHQSSASTAGGSESVLYADNSGNPKWKNDGNAVQDVLLSGTTTASISDSTNKRYVTDAQLTVLGNTTNTNTGDETQASILSKLGWVRKIQKGGTITGTVSETLVHTFPFTANEYPDSSILHVESQFIRTGTPVSNAVFRIRINTANTLVGSTQIGQTTMGGNPSLFSQFRRKFDIESGLVKGINSASFINTDLTTSALFPFSASIDTTQNWWLFITYQPQNINDIAVASFTEIKNF